MVPITLKVGAMNKGWVKIDRELLDHWSWEGSAFSEGQAIIDLHLKANYKPCKVRLRAGFITLSPGQLARSENTLAREWGWSRGKVRRFLAILEEDGVIVQHKTNQTTIITILKYGLKDEPPNNDNGKNDTANGIQVKKGEERRSIKRKEKKKSSPADCPAPKQEQTFHSEALPLGFSFDSWKKLIQHLKEKKALFAGRVKAVVAEIDKAKAMGLGVAECIACMVHHGWKGFKAVWAETSTYYRQHITAKRAREQAYREVERTNAYIDKIAKPKVLSIRERLIEETHFLLFERKITLQQRNDILADRLDISLFFPGDSGGMPCSVPG
jgi:hypothetical protein